MGVREYELRGKGNGEGEGYIRVSLPRLVERYRERQVMMPNKPKQPNAASYPAEAEKLKREQSAEHEKVGDMARRSMKKGKLTKGNHLRVP